MVPLEEAIAMEFHTTLEEFSKTMGTDPGRPRCSWEGVPEKNKELLIAVIKDLLQKGVIVSI